MRPNCDSNAVRPSDPLLAVSFTPTSSPYDDTDGVTVGWPHVRGGDSSTQLILLFFFSISFRLCAFPPGTTPVWTSLLHIIFHSVTGSSLLSFFLLPPALAFSQPRHTNRL
ncbi:hypothetical protein F5883DRAFT_61782 [Diaporthe sp. PMI_573]|nr:hypothetical protein F5883DRAFT_61782 [Diaporthaceae sp. PMI_573]